MNTIYHNAFAYGHSFSPGGSADYILSQVQSGTSLESAVSQASIEHGRAQAQEVEALLADEMQDRDYSNRRSLIPALRRVVTRARRAAAQISKERAEANECRQCGSSLQPAIKGWEMSGSIDKGARPRLCEECRPYGYECDNGHRWTATRAEDEERGGKCPKCGEYWT
jgi:hypothetical protein